MNLGQRHQDVTASLVLLCTLRSLRDRPADRELRTAGLDAPKKKTG
jgi:hypothetical protein